jgi:two-component system sensor histidine kinase UhpB
MTTHRRSATSDRLPARWTGLGSVGARRLIDALSVGLVLAALAHWGDLDLVLDALWVTLAIGAFVVGFGRTALRIGLVTLVVLAASVSATALSGQPTELELLDAEWVLMLSLSLLVARLADRVTLDARGYASLYLDANGRLLTAREEERGSLARDLHDGVGQTLTAVILTLDDAAAALATEHDPRAVRRAIGRARSLSVLALDEARSVAARLAPGRIHESGLGSALHDLASSAGVPVEVRFAPDILPPGLLEPERELDVYRVIQEAVGNAARHSHAAHVWIDAQVRGDAIAMQVRDDGVGFDTRTRSTGMGLAGMKERAAHLQGRLVVRSQPGHGTTVDLTLPMAAQHRTGPRVGIPHASDRAS